MMKARSVGTFVQIGDLAVNMARVAEIGFSEECVYLYFMPRRQDVPIMLKDDLCLAFLDWWEIQAVITQDAQPPQYALRPPNTSAWKVTPGG